MLVTGQLEGLVGGLHTERAEPSPVIVRNEREDRPDGSGELGSIVASSPPSETSSMAPSHVCTVLVLRLLRWRLGARQVADSSQLL